MYQNKSEAQEAYDLSTDLRAIGVSFNTSNLNLSYEFLKKERDNLVRFSPTMSYYENEDGFNIEGVFVGFLKNVNAKASLSGNTRLNEATRQHAIRLQNEFKRNLNSINIEKIAQDEILIEHLLKRGDKKKSQKEIQKDKQALQERIQAMLNISK